MSLCARVCRSVVCTSHSMVLRWSSLVESSYTGTSPDTDDDLRCSRVGDSCLEGCMLLSLWTPLKVYQVDCLSVGLVQPQIGVTETVGLVHDPQVQVPSLRRPLGPCTCRKRTPAESPGQWVCWFCSTGPVGVGGPLVPSTYSLDTPVSDPSVGTPSAPSDPSGRDTPTNLCDQCGL